MKQRLKALKHITQKKRFTPTIVGLALILLACWIQTRPIDSVNFLLDRIHYMIYDMRMKLATPSIPYDSTPIVIADIDEKSLAAIGRWPWPRDTLAQLVKQLFSQGAAVISFDILLSEPEENITQQVISSLRSEDQDNTQIIENLQRIAPQFNHDQILAKSLQGGDTVLGMVFHKDLTATNSGHLTEPIEQIPSMQEKNYSIPEYPRYQANLSLFQQAATAAGAISVQPDNDGIIRRAPIVYRNANSIYPSLALQTASLYLLEKDINIKMVEQGIHWNVESVWLSNRMIATDKEANVLIPFLGPAKTFPYLSAIDIIQGEIPPDKLQGALVFIGTSAFGLNDTKATPLQNIYPGVEVHATITHNILHGSFPYIPDWELGAQITVIIVIGLLLLLILPNSHVWTLIYTVIFSLTAIIGLESYLWLAHGIVLSLIVPIILIFLFAALYFIYDLFYEEQHNKEVEELFSQYVPPNYLKSMLKDSHEFDFAGESREMSVLFSDIRNFTSISEQLNVTDLKNFLNQFFSEMTAVIFEHGGTIDKYVGDMVMAFWGAPMQDPKHAKNALEAGLEMITRTKALKKSFREQGLPEVNIGVGVNSGIMNVGDMGSQFRRSYTVLGDAVNLGSRLESLSKFYGVKMITGEITQQNCPEYRFRQLDTIRVKGKQKGVKIYEPIALKQAVSAAVELDLKQFESALFHYSEQRWQQAQSILQLLIDHPGYEHLCQLYLKRIRYYRDNPPGDDWNGVYIATSKFG